MANRDALEWILIGATGYNTFANVTQNQMNEALAKAVADIHRHLQEQDDKIDKILEMISDEKN